MAVENRADLCLNGGEAWFVMRARAPALWPWNLLRGRNTVDRFSDIARGRIVVLGVGNALKGDDAVGPAVAEALREVFPDRVFDGGQAPENFAAPVRRAHPDTILLVDAADFGGEPGEVRVASPEDVSGLMMGTHAPPLSVFMSILKEDTGADVYLVAIQTASTKLGDTMCSDVLRAVAELVLDLGKLMG